MLRAVKTRIPMLLHIVKLGKERNEGKGPWQKVLFK